MSSLTRFDPKFGLGQQRTVVSSVTSMTGYLKCDGSVVSQATYPAIFTNVGLIPNNLLNATATTTVTNSVNSMVYGGGVYVAVESAGSIHSSTDAITWTSRTSGTASSINSVTYGNGLFVAAATAPGTTSQILTSTDGTTWTVRNLGVSASGWTATYLNSLYVVGTTNGRVFTSSTGTSWNQRHSFGSGNTYVLYNPNDNNYVALGNASGSAQGATSTDLITWTDADITNIGSIDGVYTFKNKMIAIDSQLMWISEDGINWQQPYPFNGTNTRTLQSISASATMVFVSDSSGGVWYSTNAVDWKRQIKPNVYILNINKILYANNQFIYVRNAIINTTTNPYTYNTASEFLLPSAYPVINNTQYLNASFFKTN